MLDQRRKRWADVVQLLYKLYNICIQKLYKCFVFTGILYVGEWGVKGSNLYCAKCYLKVLLFHVSYLIPS